jgi:hypothetical protein
MDECLSARMEVAEHPFDPYAQRRYANALLGTGDTHGAAVAYCEAASLYRLQRYFREAITCLLIASPLYRKAHCHDLANLCLVRASEEARKRGFTDLLDSKVS